MERALLQGEREAERALLQKEQKAVDQLQEKLVTLETSIQKERDKVTHNLAWLRAGRQQPGRGGEAMPEPPPASCPVAPLPLSPLTGQGVSFCSVLISWCLNADLCLPSAPLLEPGCLHPRLQTGQRTKVSAFSIPSLCP